VINQRDKSNICHLRRAFNGAPFDKLNFRVSQRSLSYGFQADPSSLASESAASDECVDASSSGLTSLDRIIQGEFLSAPYFS
jgi:hypothetical protein